MAFAVYGPFTLAAADASAMKAFRLVCIDSNGKAALPDASDLDDAIAVVGVSESQVSPAGDVTIRGFDGGLAKVTVAASETVAPGEPLFLNGTDGTVKTDTDGILVGTAVTGATSGSTNLAVITAALRTPTFIEEAGT